MEEVIDIEEKEAALNEERISFEIEQFKYIQSYIRKHMKEGEDYGKIPGSTKPSLFKSGAEKLCNLCGFAIHIDILERIENWEEGFFHYLVKCTLISRRNGELAAEGVGSCNNREGKYSRQNPYNMVNTILKMAKKRALIDATLSATRISGIFTQDIEDIGEVIPNPEESSQSASKKQLSFIVNLAKEKNIPDTELIKISESVTGKSQSKELSKYEASHLIKVLQGYRMQDEVNANTLEFH